MRCVIRPESSAQPMPVSPTNPRRRRRAVLLVPLLCLLGACERVAPPADGVAAPPPTVTVAAALAREVVDSDEFPARLAAVESIAVRARVAGYLEAIHFTPGSLVAAGDLLFIIDPRPFAARLAAARAEARRHRGGSRTRAYRAGAPAGHARRPRHLRARVSPPRARASRDSKRRWPPATPPSTARDSISATPASPHRLPGASARKRSRSATSCAAMRPIRRC